MLLFHPMEYRVSRFLEGSVDNGGTLVENGEDICRKDLFWLPGRYQQGG